VKGLTSSMHPISRSRYYLWLARTLPYILIARVTGKTCFGFEQMEPFFQDRVGLEFGGPSSIFSSTRLIPIYRISRRVDHYNFSKDIIWDSTHESIVAEASDPSNVQNESYDFVLASHVLEHLANPLRALMEWKRILRPGGVVLVVVPHKAGTFDHRRPYTTFSHLEEDYRKNATEADLTHLPEILELHDLALDPAAGTKEQFRQRCLLNESVRAMHHHVFSPELVIQMFDYAGMDVLNVAVERPCHIIVLAQTAAAATAAPTIDRTQTRNADILKQNAAWRKKAAFSS
jgi:SAM-dependent methyltransferase